MIRQVRLELARCHEFPEGSKDHGYELSLPLTRDGHLDRDNWRPRTSGVSGLGTRSAVNCTMAAMDGCFPLRPERMVTKSPSRVTSIASLRANMSPSGSAMASLEPFASPASDEDAAGYSRREEKAADIAFATTRSASR